VALAGRGYLELILSNGMQTTSKALRWLRNRPPAGRPCLLRPHQRTTLPSRQSLWARLLVRQHIFRVDRFRRISPASSPAVMSVPMQTWLGRMRGTTGHRSRTCLRPAPAATGHRAMCSSLLPLLQLRPRPALLVLCHTPEQVPSGWERHPRRRAHTVAIPAAARARLTSKSNGATTTRATNAAALVHFAIETSIHRDSRITDNHIAVFRYVAGGRVLDQLSPRCTQLAGRGQHHDGRTVSAHADVGLVHDVI